MEEERSEDRVGAVREVAETNRVVFVKAVFQEHRAERTLLVRDPEPYWLFGRIRLPRWRRERREVTLSTSDCEIDGELLAEEVRAALLALNEQGYEAVSVTAITSGQFSPRYDRHRRDRTMARNAMRRIGYGFSYTEGVLIVAEKRRGD